MKSVFATVGTTSFDDFVRSLCSLPFLTAIADHHDRAHRPPAAASPPPGPPLPARASPRASSPASSASLASGRRDAPEDAALDLTIQYGRGRCPRACLPPAFVVASVHEADDGSGSLVVAVPVRSTAAADRGDASSAEAHGRTRRAGAAAARGHRRIRVRWYRFRPSLAADMERADVILTHAGAGTLVEALAASSSARPKVINAVINSTLMHNHQLELAEELERRGHIRVTRECAAEWTAEDGAA